MKSLITNQFSFVCKKSFFFFPLWKILSSICTWFLKFVEDVSGCRSFKLYVGHSVWPFSQKADMFSTLENFLLWFYFYNFSFPPFTFFSVLFLELLFDRWWIIVFVSLTFPSYFSPFKLEFSDVSFQPSFYFNKYIFNFPEYLFSPFLKQPEFFLMDAVSTWMSLRICIGAFFFFNSLGLFVACAHLDAVSFTFSISSNPWWFGG